jgi:hypothetical protein
MSIFSVFRPTPGKFLLEILPQYLAETERPIETQAILSGSESFVHDVTDEPLKTIVEARAITSGVLMSAFIAAKSVCSKGANISSDEYEEFRAKIEAITIGSTDPKKDSRMQKTLFKELWASVHCMAIQIEINNLTKKHILEMPGSAEIEAWVEGIAGLYSNAMRHCVTKDDDKRLQAILSEDEFDERNNFLAEHCLEFGKQHTTIMSTVTIELLELMDAKGVRL